MTTPIVLRDLHPETDGNTFINPLPKLGLAQGILLREEERTVEARRLKDIVYLHTHRERGGGDN